MRRVTRACCGNAVTNHVEDMERCTAANNMDSVWDGEDGPPLFIFILFFVLLFFPVVRDDTCFSLSQKQERCRGLVGWCLACLYLLRVNEETLVNLQIWRTLSRAGQ
jgi:hypothetical protein